jgi:hypothetical protein
MTALPPEGDVTDLENLEMGLPLSPKSGLLVYNGARVFFRLKVAMNFSLLQINI